MVCYYENYTVVVLRKPNTTYIEETHFSVTQLGG